MAAQVKATGTRSDAANLTYGKAKFLRDVWTVLEMKVLYLFKGWYLYVVRPLIFPLGIFYWLRTVAPEDPEVVRRVMAGAIIFGFSLSTVNMLSQQLIMDRFYGRLKLMITMPMSKAAYALGVLAFAAIQAVPIVVLLLAIAPVSGVDFDLTWAFFLLLVPVILTMAGLTFMIASFAPSQEAGSIMANLVGIVLVAASPVFFTMDQAPMLLKWLGWVSPMRYAADGVMESLSGSTDIWTEFLILVGFAVATMVVGLWRLSWRER